MTEDHPIKMLTARLLVSQPIRVNIRETIKLWGTFNVSGWKRAVPTHDQPNSTPPLFKPSFNLGSDKYDSFFPIINITCFVWSIYSFVKFWRHAVNVDPEFFSQTVWPRSLIICDCVIAPVKRFHDVGEEKSVTDTVENLYMFEGKILSVRSILCFEHFPPCYSWPLGWSVGFVRSHPQSYYFLITKSISVM